jgi:hypothetical protein
MSLEVYRGYKDTPYYGDNPEEVANSKFEEVDHIISIITTESTAKYAAPDELKYIFNDDRVQIIIDLYKSNNVEDPKTPLEWAQILSENLSTITVVKVSEEDLGMEYETEDLENAVRDEEIKVQETYNRREG